jgi:hypothetical protein
LLDVIPAAAVLQMAGARTGLGWSAYPARVRLGSKPFASAKDAASPQIGRRAGQDPAR